MDWRRCPPVLLMYLKRKVIRGVSVSSGIAMGQALAVHPGSLKVGEFPVAANQVDNEIKALEDAVEDTVEEIKSLRKSAVRKLAKSVSRVFDAQLLIAEDKDFLNQVKEQIASKQRNAGFIYNAAVQETLLALKMSTDPYLQQMVQEIEAVSNRVLSHLAGVGERSTARLPENSILVGKSFNANEILEYRNRKAIGFLVGEGGVNSHMGLIARSLLMPVAIVGNAWTHIPGEAQLILDGTEGKVIVHPSKSEWNEYLERRKRLGPALLSRIKKLKEIPPKTVDNVAVSVAANMEFPGPVEDILAEQKIPIGLYRTEFLYLDGDSFPDEQAQFEYYKRIADKFQDSYVIFRTFDLGSDKVRVDSGVPVPAEDNPALGWRGIRSMLDLKETFKAQIRAILRASTHRNVKILLPMVTDIGELRRARRLISQAMLELRRQKVKFDDKIQIGVMIEVPAAALTADELADHADFLSIGTNDLTQYTLSADRNNQRVAGLYNPFHPSVLNLIRMTVDACRRRNRPVHICGESAGDHLAIPLFVGMGVTSLSMNPGRIFDACRLIQKLDTKLVRQLVGPVVDSRSAQAAIRRLQNYRDALEGIE